MSEHILSNDLESEIAELSRQIEDKKRALEMENGISHEEREVVSQAVAEHFYPDFASSDTVSPNNNENPADDVVKPKATLTKDYLDTLVPETVEAVNAYVSMIPREGIRKTINKVQTEQPFLIDAFHDALVTRLYDELKDRGIIK